jgi:outer membrane protein TolC
MGRRAVAMGAALLAGCAVGPDYHGPPAAEKAAPAKFKNASTDGRWKVAEPIDDKAGGEWWSVFHDGTLDGLIQQGLAKNQDLRVAAARIAESRSMARVAAADFYPQVTLNPSAVRQRTSNTDPIQRAALVGPSPFGGAASSGASAGAASPAKSASSSSSMALAEQPLSSTFNLFRAPIMASWELDLFGRVRRSYEAARATAQAAQADYRNMALSVRWMPRRRC